MGILAGEARAVEGEAVEGAEYGDGDEVGAKILLGEGPEFVGGNGFNGSENFVERVEAAEVQLLAGEIGHAGAGGLEGKHERALEVIFGAAKFFLGDERFLQGAKFLDGEVDDLADGFFTSAGVDGVHASVGVGREFAENGVGEALLFANVLEEAGGHATAEKIVEHGDTEALFVAERNAWNADAEMDLFKVALGFEMDRRACGRSGVFAIGTSGL